MSVGLGEPGRHIGDDKKEILKLFKNQYGLVYIEEEEGTRGGFKQLYFITTVGNLWAFFGDKVGSNEVHKHAAN